MIESTQRLLAKWRPVVVMGLCGALFNVLSIATPQYPWAAAAAVSFLAAFASLWDACCPSVVASPCGEVA